MKQYKRELYLDHGIVLGNAIIIVQYWYHIAIGIIIGLHHIEHRKYKLALLIIFLNTSREYINATKKLDFPLQRMPLNAINRTFLDEYSNLFIRKWAIFPTTFWTKESKHQTGVCNFKGVSVSINHLVTFPVAARYYLNLLRLSTHIFIFNWNNCLMDDSFSKIHGICSLIDGLITCRKYTLY